MNFEGMQFRTREVLKVNETRSQQNRNKQSTVNSSIFKFIKANCHVVLREDARKNIFSREERERCIIIKLEVLQTRQWGYEGLIKLHK